ncbi:MAG: uroporphyrinogen-III synthase [Gammaproteobacteria bacterium]|nr:uroporphyrinogen-III synthase [Gammaproteobacteria bacterium]
MQSAGFDTLTLPVLEIEPVVFDLPAPSFDVVIFLSEHAVRHVGALDFCHGARVLAVGPSTAAALSRAGVSVETDTRACQEAEADPEDSRTHSRGQGSEGLLESVILQHVAGRSVLIVSGVGGRRLLADELQRRGASVTQLRCYRRKLLLPRLPDPATVGAILVGSGDGFDTVARVWFDAQGRPDVPVLVPSARVAGLGTALGFSRVIDCAGAGIDAYLTVLRTLEEE